jgi:RNA-directed DNA polymerase
VELLIRYADDFLLIHYDLNVVQRCRELISEWLKDIGLELKPSKTRIAHTLHPEFSEDGTAGFNFLGYNIRQFPVGKYKSALKANKDLVGFKTLIIPAKDSCNRHQEKIRSIIRKHKSSPQAKLITELNPIIRGWCNYFKLSDAQTTKEFPRQDHLVFRNLRAWGRYRCGNLKDARKKYFTKIGKRDWIFATREGDANPFRLLLHSDFGSSSNNYVKVKGEKSPFDGNLIYWSTRMGVHPEMPTSKAIRLNKQKGKCNWCGLHFREGDILEEDHIISTALGGKNIYDNLQILHGHCHDAKTAMDLIDIRNKQSLIFFEKLAKEWSKTDYIWIDDVPVIFSS